MPSARIIRTRRSRRDKMLGLIEDVARSVPGPDRGEPARSREGVLAVVEAELGWNLDDEYEWKLALQAYSDQHGLDWVLLPGFD